MGSDCSCLFGDRRQDHLHTQNLRGQTLLFRCLETGFVTTAPALTRYQ
jgi:hypothetical protein